MAINFGTAARNAASDIVKRRRGNPDPDGVIASRVADQIVQNSSRDIGAFLQSAPAPNPAPRAREMASDNARFMRDFMGGGGNSSETSPDILAALLPTVGGPMMRGPVQFDNQTFPVYEGGSSRMGAPAPFPITPQPQYPSGGGTASPFGTMPAPPTLLPGMQERMDPETIAVLRYLGLI